MGVFSIDGEAYESQKIQGSFCEETFEAFVWWYILSKLL